MKYVFMLMGKFFKGFGAFSKFIPLGIGGLFLFVDFIIHWVKYGFLIAISSLAKSVFTAELIINEKVNTAIYAPHLYSFIDFVHIIVSIFVLYSLVKWIGKAKASFDGSQASTGNYVIAGLIVLLISVTGIAIQDKQLGFIPIYHSIIFMVQNLHFVLGSIFVWKAPELVETAVNMTNSTL